MRVSIAEAAEHLPDLLDRAEAGEDVILTEGGRPVWRLQRIEPAADVAPPDVQARRRAVIEALQAEATAHATPGPDAARSQDFLYDENGLPG